LGQMTSTLTARPPRPLNGLYIVVYDEVKMWGKSGDISTRISSMQTEFRSLKSWIRSRNVNTYVYTTSAFIVYFRGGVSATFLPGGLAEEASALINMNTGWTGHGTSHMEPVALGSRPNSPSRTPLERWPLGPVLKWSMQFHTRIL
jgi:hypothetical protein